MSEITLVVGGRNFPISCEDGQEDHVRKLAEIVDRKLRQIGGNLASGDAKNMLFAALFLADELEEARTAGKSATIGNEASKTLEEIAETLERTATLLEERATSS